MVHKFDAMLTNTPEEFWYNVWKSLIGLPLNISPLSPDHTTLHQFARDCGFVAVWMPKLPHEVFMQAFECSVFASKDVESSLDLPRSGWLYVDTAVQSSSRDPRGYNKGKDQFLERMNLSRSRSISFEDATTFVTRLVSERIGFDKATIRLPFYMEWVVLANVFRWIEYNLDSQLIHDFSGTDKAEFVSNHCRPNPQGGLPEFVHLCAAVSRHSYVERPGCSRDLFPLTTHPRVAASTGLGYRLVIEL